MITVGSLYSGYGGLELGVALASGLPVRVLWHCDSDPDASHVLGVHDPDVPNLDKDTIDWSQVEPSDLLAMGPPCQPASQAGRGLLDSDPRWRWPYARAALLALRPAAFLFENVTGLVSARKGAVWRAILSDMQLAGYSVAWGVYGACLVGAPHHRHRVFAIGRRGVGDPRRIGAQAFCGAPRGALLPSPMARDGDPGQRGEGSAAYWQRRQIERSTEGIPLGAAVKLLPTITAGAAKRGHNSVNGRGEPDLAGIARLLPSPRGSDGRNGGPNQGIASGDVALSSAVIGDRWAQYGSAVRRWEAIHGPAPTPTEPTSRGGGYRLAPELPEWMMGLPAGYLTNHVGRVPALRLAGNGACPQQVAHAVRALWNA